MPGGLWPEDHVQMISLTKPLQAATLTQLHSEGDTEKALEGSLNQLQEKAIKKGPGDYKNILKSNILPFLSRLVMELRFVFNEPRF